MDVNREIAKARAAHQAQLQESAAYAAQRASEQAALQQKIDEICAKFVRWARQSGTPTTINVRQYGAPIKVGRGRRARTTSNELWVGVWALNKTEGTSEAGFGESHYTHIYLGIDENGKIYPETPPNGTGRLPSVDELMNCIVKFIAQTGSTVPWPN